MSSNPPASESGLPQALSAVVGRIGAEVAMPLTTALERVLAMASSGQIDRASLQSLRIEIDFARRAGMRGQQIARLAEGQVHQAPERLDLARLLREVLTEQATQTAAGTVVGSRQQLAPAVVMADASLLATLLRAAADWGLAHARGPLSWRLDVLPWPVQARLVCVLTHQPDDEALPDAADGQPVGTVTSDGQTRLTLLDNLDWLLLQFAAHMGGVAVQRDDTARQSTLTLLFPHTVTAALETLDGGPPAGRLVAGSQVLVLASQRGARQRVRDALHGHDVFIDYVPSVAAARGYCEDGTPQALLFESAFDGDQLRALCQRLSVLQPNIVLIELTPGGQEVERDSHTGLPLTRIGNDALRTRLATVMAAALATAASD